MNEYIQVRRANDGDDDPLYMLIQISDNQNNFEKIIVIIICLSFLVLLIISLIWVLFYYFQRFRLLHRQYAAQKKQEKAMKKAFSKMKGETLKSDSELVTNHEEICCAICIGNFEAGSVVRHLTCTHVYHKKCIDPWLVDKGTCPQCKADILKSLGLGEAIQQPSPIAESSLTENDEENPLEAPSSGEAADTVETATPDAVDGETESPDGDVTDNNVENIETRSESGDLTPSGQNNEAFEPEENVVIENETNPVVVKQNKKEDRSSDILPGMQTPDEEESHNKTATGFSADDSTIETEQPAENASENESEVKNEESNSKQKSTF